MDIGSLWTWGKGLFSHFHVGNFYVYYISFYMLSKGHTNEIKREIHELKWTLTHNGAEVPDNGDIGG